jgi:hypothetical protein
MWGPSPIDLSLQPEARSERRRKEVRVERRRRVITG